MSMFDTYLRALPVPSRQTLAALLIAVSTNSTLWGLVYSATVTDALHVHVDTLSNNGVMERNPRHE